MEGRTGAVDGRKVAQGEDDENTCAEVLGVSGVSSRDGRGMKRAVARRRNLKFEMVVAVATAAGVSQRTKGWPGGGWRLATGDWRATCEMWARGGKF